MREENSEKYFNELNVERIVRMAKLRRNVGKPDQQGVNAYAARMPTVSHDIAINSLSSERLLVFKSIMEEIKGKQMSIPRFCSSFLMEILGVRYMKLAEEYAESENKSSFIFFYDFTAGFRISLGTIIDAEGKLDSGNDEEVSRRVSYLGVKFGYSLDEQADTYLWLQEFNAKALELLIQDRSGFSLLSLSEEKIKNSLGSDANSAFVPEYMLMGAKMASHLYKMLYNKIEPLYSKK